MDPHALLKSHVDAYTRKDGAVVSAHDTKVQKHADQPKKTKEAATPVEAYGVRGMKSTPWRKQFKSSDHLNKWQEANDSVEVHGMRELETARPSEKPARDEGLPPAVRAAVTALSPHNDDEWDHSGGSSKIACGRHRAADSTDVLFDHGFRMTGGDDDEMKHPDGHTATISDGGLTIKHGGKP